jgi:hypothetical protein
MTAMGRMRLGFGTADTKVRLEDMFRQASPAFGRSYAIGSATSLVGGSDRLTHER